MCFNKKARRKCTRMLTLVPPQSEIPSYFNSCVCSFIISKFSRLLVYNQKKKLIKNIYLKPAR